jgi:hypothetical protein
VPFVLNKKKKLKKNRKKLAQVKWFVVSLQRLKKISEDFKGV